MRRARIVIPIVFAVFVFAGLSALLARGLTASGTERSKVFDLLETQAKGNADATLAQLPACKAQPACATELEDRVSRFRAPGQIQILSYSPSARLALTRKIGTARVAWRAGTALPVVQCVRVQRDGPLAGGDVQLLSLSAPIARDGSCQP